MNIPCLYGINCTGQADFPITNYSAEAPEQVPTFYSLVFPESWDRQGCLSLCVSEVSQQDADLCALAQAAACQPPVIFNPGNDLPGEDDGGTVGPTFTTRFYNTEQIATVQCPDGSDFELTVPAGTFSADTQEAADARALAYAQKRIFGQVICIGELENQGVCVGEDYSETVSVETDNPPIVVSLIEGVLPPGFDLDFDISSFTLLGNTPSPGQYDFRVEVEDFIGNTKQKDFSIVVIEIATTSLSNGEAAVPYSDTLIASSPIAATWSITEGSLPDGLTLNPSTGEISGTPTKADVYTFTATATVGTISCSKEFTVEIEGVRWQDLTWSLQVPIQQDGNSTAEWISPSAGAQSDEWEAATSASYGGGDDTGRVRLLATMVYAGPNRSGQVQVTVSTNNDDGTLPGLNNSTVGFFINAVLQTQATMPAAPPTFNGVYTLNITAMAGTLLFIIDLFSSNPLAPQPVPMTIRVSGAIVNI